MRRRLIALTLIPLSFVLTTSMAWAHPGHHHAHGGLDLWAGLLHPLTGADHLIAALAVGAWAIVLGGRAIWQLPAAFLLAMVAGGIAVLFGLNVGGVDVMTAATVITLGVMLGLAAKLPRTAAISMVAVFGTIHGASHLAGAAAFSGTTALFMGAMLLSTAALHVGGLALAQRFFTPSKLMAPRWAGAVVTLTGVALIVHQFI